MLGPKPALNGSAMVWDVAKLNCISHVVKAKHCTALITNCASLYKKVAFSFAVKAVLDTRRIVFYSHHSRWTIVVCDKTKKLFLLLFYNHSNGYRQSFAKPSKVRLGSKRRVGQHFLVFDSAENHMSFHSESRLYWQPELHKSPLIFCDFSVVTAIIWP